MDKYIGRLLDNRYEILEEIGNGGMAVVYRARCHRLNRLVAIKILKDEHARDDDFRRRFQAESQAVAMLSHPNIVSVYDVSKSDDLNYIVMELIDGLSLKQYMEAKGQLTWRETLHFAAQIARALEHAHGRGIVHRDIKPHNIMVLKDGSVKVADFGIAHMNSSQNTLTREALGSVHYISPEQAKGGRVDSRSDLYSLGVVMYEMLTGRPPYDGETPVSVAIQHINSTPVPPSLLNSEIPAGLEQIILHAMASDLEQRYASATEMISDMEEFRKKPDAAVVFSGAKSHVEVPQQTHSAKPRPQKRESSAVQEEKKHTGATVLAVICIVLAVFGIFYFLYSYFLRDIVTDEADVPIPALVGKVYSELDASDYPDFVIEYGGSQTSDQYPAGYIINQSPKSGKDGKSGSTITIIVSSGPMTGQMPDLFGRTQSEAETALNALGINLTVRVSEGQTTDAALIGRVIEYSPNNGTVLYNGDTIELVLGVIASESTTQQTPEDENQIVPPETSQSGPTTDQPTENHPIEDENPGDTPTNEDPVEDPVPEQPNGETPSEQTPIEPEVVKKTISVTIPGGEGTVTVTLKLDDAATGSEYTVELTEEPIERQFLIEGSGVRQLDVYINGVLIETRTVTFS